MKKEYHFYVYIATNHPRNTVLYTGVTNGLIKRSGQHAEKRFPGSFTARYNVNRIVYFETFGDIHAAIDREKQIKAGSRKKKVDLIDGINPGWNDLVEEMLK